MAPHVRGGSHSPPYFSTNALVVGANRENESVGSAIEGFRDAFATDIFPTTREKHLEVEYLRLGIADSYTGVEIHIVQGIESWLFTDELTDDILLNAHDAAVRKEKEMTEK